MSLIGLLVVACDVPPGSLGGDTDLNPENPVEPNLPDVTNVSLRSPLRITLTPESRLLVSDSRSQMVLELDPETFLPSKGFRVAGKPLGVAIWGDRIFVGNETRHTVDVFDPNGLWQQSFGRGSVGQPADIAVDPDLGLVFVVDGLAGEVKVFTVDGTPVRTITGFHAPTGIALVPGQREVLVADYGPGGGDASVEIYAYDGTWRAAIRGNFSRPQGLGVDPTGRVYLADAVVAQVLVFDRTTLQQVGELGSGDPAVSDLRLPTDIVVDETGGVFVVSNLTAAVVRFSVGGLQP